MFVSNVQGSALVSDHIGLIGGYSNYREEGDYTDNMKFRKFEVGAGYVTTLSPRWHFETYAGVGKGKIENIHVSGYSNFRMSHFFLQPAFVVAGPKKTVSLALVSRLSRVTYSDRQIYIDADREAFSAKQLLTLSDKPTFFVLEPGIVARFGWKNLQFQAGYSASTNLTHSDLHASSGNFTLGGLVKFNTRKVKK